ncbi:uncharacterized protein BDW70DRAFT_129399 [Aspergillus foveolatus]|uniref:uncharacterized protein n=1 Tax=Aspergillus foveolatus TaxID=210207 RepID=UPI003CCD96DE
MEFRNSNVDIMSLLMVRVEWEVRLWTFRAVETSCISRVPESESSLAEKPQCSTLSLSALRTFADCVVLSGIRKLTLNAQWLFTLSLSSAMTEYLYFRKPMRTRGHGAVFFAEETKLNQYEVQSIDHHPCPKPEHISNPFRAQSSTAGPGLHRMIMHFGDAIV